jgi:geranylgeranyl diphosphate synthase type II
VLARASGADGLVAGEIVDVLTEGQPYDAATLDYIHSRKTGALLAASCEMGALLSEADEAQVLALRTYGQHLGLAFQIADDILNETATEEELGKATGSDRSRGKATYPHLHGMDGARAAAARETQLAIDALPQSLENRDFLVSLAEFTIQRKS